MAAARLNSSQAVTSHSTCRSRWLRCDKRLLPPTGCAAPQSVSPELPKFLDKECKGRQRSRHLWEIRCGKLLGRPAFGSAAKLYAYHLLAEDVCDTASFPASAVPSEDGLTTTEYQRHHYICHALRLPPLALNRSCIRKSIGRREAAGLPRPRVSPLEASALSSTGEERRPTDSLTTAQPRYLRT